MCRLVKPRTDERAIDEVCVPKGPKGAAICELLGVQFFLFDKSVGPTLYLVVVLRSSVQEVFEVICEQTERTMRGKVRRKVFIRASRPTPTPEHRGRDVVGRW